MADDGRRINSWQRSLLGGCKFVAVGLVGLAAGVPLGLPGGAQASTARLTGQGTRVVSSSPPSVANTASQLAAATGRPSAAAVPNTNLATGQIITVSGSGFSPNATIAVIECDSSPTGPADCDLSTDLYVQATTAGTFITYYTAQRIITVSSRGRIDCAQPLACVLGVGNLANMPQGTLVPIAFDPNAPPPAPPSASAVPSSGLVSGQIITVSGSGFNPSATIAVLECVSSATGLDDCDPSTDVFLQPTAAGTFITLFTAQRIITVSSGGRIDCAQPQACVLGVGNPYIYNSPQEAFVPIAFDPNGPLPQPPSASAVPNSALAPGQIITVSGSSFNPKAPIVVVECDSSPKGPADCDLSTELYVQATTAGTFITYYTAQRFITVSSRSRIDCAQPDTCVLSVGNLYSVGIPGNPGNTLQEALVPIAFKAGVFLQGHADGSIWQYVGPPMSGWAELDNNPATFTMVTDGTGVYQLHRDGAIWQYTGTLMARWTLLDNNPATVQIAVSDGNLYQLHRDGTIWQYTRTLIAPWTRLDNNPATVGIVADGPGLYQRHRDGTIWHTGTLIAPWTLLDNNPATVQIAASGGNLYQLHRDGTIWQYTGTLIAPWTLLDNNPATVGIVADGPALYQLHRDGTIWQYGGPPITGWALLDRNPLTVAIAAGEGNFYQLHRDGTLWQYAGSPARGWVPLDNNPATNFITSSGGNAFMP